VEKSRRGVDRLARPVLFGDNGAVRVNYEIDGWHLGERVVLEVESGRGWQGNAFYRDIVRMSLIHDARFGAVGMRSSYSFGGGEPQNDFAKARDQLDAVYASGRLMLPFEGMLLFGW
jgi:hypothetical protein